MGGEEQCGKGGGKVEVHVSEKSEAFLSRSLLITSLRFVVQLLKRRPKPMKTSVN